MAGSVCVGEKGGQKDLGKAVGHGHSSRSFYGFDFYS